MQDIIKTDKPNYIPKRRKVYNFSEYSLPIDFLRGINEGYFLLKDADDQSNFAAKLKNLDKGKNNWKIAFLNNLGLLFSTREKVLNSFKSRKEIYIRFQHVNQHHN